VIAFSDCMDGVSYEAPRVQRGSEDTARLREQDVRRIADLQLLVESAQSDAVAAVHMPGMPVS